VSVFSGRDDSLLSQFYAYPFGNGIFFTGGVRVGAVATGAGGANRSSILTAAGAGGNPQVNIFDLSGNLLNAFFAQTITGGIFVGGYQGLLRDLAIRP
jgi:hypothetical protein